jgi:hypothetical protein
MMHRSHAHRMVISLVMALLLMACAGGEAVRPPVVRAAAFERGVLYTSLQAGEYAGAESDATLAEVVKPLGVNWVAIVVTCYQETVTATTIDCQSRGTATDDDLTHAIDVAHRQGLKVMLTPHIDPRDYPTHWRGDITFGNDTAAWRTWFAGYTTFITHYATLARTTGADAFVVGTELQGTSGHVDEWRAVAKAVRAVYPGMMTYAANHGEETSVQWWDALDAIGVDGYYALTQRDDPTLAQLRAAWQPIVTGLADLAAKWQRPILLTEIGYQSRVGTNRAPWGVDAVTVDPEEQAACYQAVFDVFANQSWLLGMFWWNILPRRDQGGPSDTDYTPIGKPAARVLRGNFENPP